MKKVFRLVEYVCKDTISILKVLLAMALKGQLRGLIVCYRTKDGQESTVFTGLYKANPADAAGTTMRLSMTLIQENREFDRRH